MDIIGSRLVGRIFPSFLLGFFLRGLILESLGISFEGPSKFLLPQLVPVRLTRAAVRNNVIGVDVSTLLFSIVVLSESVLVFPYVCFFRQM